jgi:hypothetical protein
MRQVAYTFCLWNKDTRGCGVDTNPIRNIKHCLFEKNIYKIALNQPTFGLALLVFALCRALPFMPFPLSNEYIPPAPNTITAPSRVPGDNLFPNSQILISRLTSFRTFKTIVTDSAEAVAASRLTPRMHAYCVRTFTTR